MITLPDKIKNDLSSSITSAEYLLYIEGETQALNTYIGSRQQMFEDEQSSLQFYEDLNIKISGIREKIDLKTKKINLSTVTISFNNFKNNSGRLSDRIGNGVGHIINVYIKTQSCESITDCMQIATLKITRVSHDSEKITINADDISLDSFFIQLPVFESVLSSSNTFPHYEDRPVPILFGHLENAPAVPYIPDMSDDYYANNGIEIVCDSSRVTENGEIYGIKDFTIPGMYLTYSHSYWDDEAGTTIPGVEQTSEPIYECNLEVDNTLKVGIGNRYCYVNCLPYMNANVNIADNYHNYEQYVVEHDRIRLTSKHESLNTVLFNNAMWIHSHDKEESSSRHTLWMYSANFTNASIFVYWNPGSSLEMYDLTTNHDVGEWSTESNFDSGFTSRMSIGVERYSFAPLSGQNPYKEEDEDGKIHPYPTDINYTGNLGVWINDAVASGSNPQVTLKKHKMYGYPSGFVLDEDATGDITDTITDIEAMGASQMGFPPEVGGDFESDPNGWLGRGIFDIFVPNIVYTKSFFGVDKTASTTGESYNWMSYFESNLFPEASQAPPFQSRFADDYDWKVLNCNELSFYHVPVATGLSSETMTTDGSDFYDVYDDDQFLRYDVKTIHSNLALKRYWAEADIFSKDFFVNATGRSDGVYENISTIKGVIAVSHESLEIPDYGNNDTPTPGFPLRHLRGIYKLLNDIKLREITHNGDVYKLMLHNPHSTSSDPDNPVYLYDIEVENMIQNGELANIVAQGIDSSYLDDDDIPVVEGSVGSAHQIGWEFYIKAKKIGDATYTSVSAYPGITYIQGFKFIYGKINFIAGTDNEVDYAAGEGGVDILDESQLPEPLTNYLDIVFNNHNFYNEYSKGYSRVWWDTEGETLNAPKVAEKPAEIVKNLLKNEMGVSEGMVDDDKYYKSVKESHNSKLAFSINERRNSKDIIEDICSQSRLFFRYRPRDGRAIIDSIKNRYTPADVDKTINSENVLKFSFAKSKMEDLCIGGCLVKYNHNYLTGKNDSTTPWASLDATIPEGETDSLLTKYRNHYGIAAGEEKNYRLEIEAPFITSYSSAIEFRDFMFEFYKNQHLVLKLTLPLNEGAELEVGDVVSFTNNINNTNCYGRSLMYPYALLSQIVYPYYLITSCSKNLKEVKVEAIQLHEIEPSSSYESATVIGCTDPTASNHNPDATIDDGSCEYAPLVGGCTNPIAQNYNEDADYDDGTCTYDPMYYGCMDENADNYNPDAIFEGEACEYTEPDTTLPNAVLSVEGYRYYDSSDYTYVFFVGDTIRFDSSQSTDDSIIANANITNVESPPPGTEDFANFVTSHAPEGWTYNETNEFVEEYGYIATLEFQAVSEMLTAEGTDDEHAQYFFSLQIVDEALNQAYQNRMIKIIPHPNFALGDINLDGDVNVQDIILMVGYIIHSGVGADITDPYILLLMDLNEDGAIDVLDVVAVVNIVLNS